MWLDLVDLTPGHPAISSGGLINYIQWVGLSSEGMQGQCCKHKPHSSLHVPSGHPSLSPSAVLIRHPSPLAPFASLPKHAWHCIPLPVHHHYSENAPLYLPYLYFSLSVSLFLTRVRTVAAQIHTQKASVRMLYLRLLLWLNKECEWPSVKRLQDLNKDTVSMPSVLHIVSMADPEGFNVWEWVWVCL